MLKFRKHKETTNNTEPATKSTSYSNREIIDATEDLKDAFDVLSEKMDKFIDGAIEDYKLRIDNLKDEIRDLKAELKKKNEFIEGLVLQLIDQGASKKPLSATEAYLAKKAADGHSSKTIPLPGK